MNDKLLSDLPSVQSYENQPKVLLAVDCIIFGFDNEQLKVLLIKRGFEPEKGKWSLMGGFLQPDENLDNSAQRVLKKLTGLNNVYLEQLSAFSEPDRDMVERTVSVAYFALINIENHNEEISQMYSAEWFTLDEIPELIFDHRQMIEFAINRLRYKTSIEPIGFELLPEKFTMRQLQKLYEAILGQELDKRNFTKKINQLDVLKRLDEKDMTSSKKGSYLHTFDQEKYNSKITRRFEFRL